MEKKKTSFLMQFCELYRHLLFQYFYIHIYSIITHILRVVVWFRCFFFSRYFKFVEICNQFSAIQNVSDRTKLLSCLVLCIYSSNLNWFIRIGCQWVLLMITMKDNPKFCIAMSTVQNNDLSSSELWFECSIFYSCIISVIHILFHHLVNVLFEYTCLFGWLLLKIIIIKVATNIGLDIFKVHCTKTSGNIDKSSPKDDPTTLMQVCNFLRLAIVFSHCRAWG